MKERYRKQKFLKGFDLVPSHKHPRSVDCENDNDINERLCFYYFDDEEHVTCRGCYSRFKTWLDYRIHFNGSCHITETNYKLNTYNDVYKKYKLRKAKTKKKMNDRLSAAQLMDLETLNTRKTRKRCYANTWVVMNNMPINSVNMVHSSDCSSSENSLKAAEILGSSSVSSDSSGAEESKPNTICRETVQDIPYSTNDETSYIPQDNQLTSTIKEEWNANDISQVSPDYQCSDLKYEPKYEHSNIKYEPKYEHSDIKYEHKYENSDIEYEPMFEHSGIKYEPKENKSGKYVCVICDERFSNKCSLTLHQVQHIKANRNAYGVFVAALARTA